MDKNEQVSTLLRVRLSLDHAKFFIGSKQKMHPAGQEDHQTSIDELDTLIKDLESGGQK